MKSVWQEVTRRMIELETQMPHVWPPELPEESTEDFWWHAQRAEMQTRESVDGLLQLLLNGRAPVSISALEGWMIQRRIEWAGQLLIEAVGKVPFPQEDVETLLRWLLLESWESDGQHGFHKHAARDGAYPLDDLEDR